MNIWNVIETNANITPIKEGQLLYNKTHNIMFLDFGGKRPILEKRRNKIMRLNETSDMMNSDD